MLNTVNLGLLEVLVDNMFYLKCMMYIMHSIC